MTSDSCGKGVGRKPMKLILVRSMRKLCLLHVLNVI